jgi:hypothetical protein
MDWLLDQQPAIEQRLAARHLRPGGLVLYDLSSSYFEGTKCPLAKHGYSRDGKRNRLQVNYGLVTDARGCPVAISVFPGNVHEATTLLPEVARLRERFGLRELILVGDRGMIAQAAIEEMRSVEGLAWITALKTPQIRALRSGGTLQLGLFDDRHLFEITDPRYPGERLVACRNPELAKLRAHKREALVTATETALARIARRVTKGRLCGRAEIGLCVGRVINKYKVAKHFKVTITTTTLAVQRRKDRMAAEAALDGIYVIRTNLPATTVEAADAVRQLQGAEYGGARVSNLEDGRPSHPPDSSLPRGSRPQSHLPLHAGVLRGMASAGGVAAAVICRRGSGRQGDAGSGGAGDAIRGRGAKSRRPAALGWHASP